MSNTHHHIELFGWRSIMHHKRKRPKNRRAGCLMCKPWKVNGAGGSNRMELPEKFSDYKRRMFTD